MSEIITLDWFLPSPERNGILPQYLTEGEMMWVSVIGPAPLLLANELHRRAVKLRHRDVDVHDLADELGMPVSRVRAALVRLAHAHVIEKDRDSILVPTAFPLPSSSQMHDARRKQKQRGWSRYTG